MTPQNQIANQEVGRLVEMQFVFHAWQNLPILGSDGPMFHLDTRLLDIDLDKKQPDGKSGGISYLKRLRMLPVSATMRPQINNREGFAVSNMFVGSVGADGQSGIGSGMAGASRTNVQGVWHYASEKVSDMVWTFGKYGLVPLNSLRVQTADDYKRCQTIFSVVTAGLTGKEILEDLPEYFGETSEYLPEKPPARFARTAYDCITESDVGILIGRRKVKLTASELATARALADEMKAAVMGALYAALDADGNGILPKTRDAIASREKLGPDKADIWLMGQFPSFPMDTQLEKSNKQLMRVLGDSPEIQQMPDGVTIPLSQFTEMLERLAKLEGKAEVKAEALAEAAG